MKNILKICMSYLQEIGTFTAIVGTCVLLGTIALNFQAFIGTVQDTVWGIQAINTDILKKEQEQVRLGSLITETSEVLHGSAPTQANKQFGYHKDMEQYLKRQFKHIKLSFNLLPPDNYLIVPEIGVQVRLVDTHMVSSDVLAHGDFESYLQQGVVKYPATADPGTIGNSLLFGHTSLEPWKLAKNKYGTIFRNIPKLEAGSKFSVIWNGEQYNYNVVEKAIKNPKDVKKFYKEYGKDNSYVSLMGCYPIGTDKQRVMIVGELADRKLAKIDSESDAYMAYKNK